MLHAPVWFMLHAPAWFQSVHTRWPRVLLLLTIAAIAVVAIVLQPDVMTSDLDDQMVVNYVLN